MNIIYFDKILKTKIVDQNEIIYYPRDNESPGMHLQTES
jgi:hypothetical protein